MRPLRRMSRRAALPACGLFLSLIALPASAQVQRDRGNPFKPPRATEHVPRVRDYHVRHMRLVFDVDAVNHSAEGEVTHFLSPLRGSLDRIVLDAGSNLKITRCTVNGQESKFTHENSVLTIVPAAPLPQAREAAVAIRYTMPAGKTGGGANGAGGFHWVNPSPDNTDRRPCFWTQGETDTNHTWVPCYDFPNDKLTSETIVTVPQDWVVIGNGAEGPTSYDPTKKTRTFRWTMKQPHSTYLLSLVGGEFDVKKSSWAGVPLYYVVPRGKGDLIDGSFGNTPDMLSFFSKVLGVRYPWPKYAQSAVPDFPGGMENVSATTLGNFGLSDRRSGRYPMSSLVAHELAHQWFGDLVTCKDWGDVWLNEGFATFFEALYMEHSEGKEHYDLEIDSNIRQYLNEARRYIRPVSTSLYANPNVLFDSHTYPKGGVILHMLRRSLGDRDFFRGLGHYLRVHAYEAVDTNDLIKALEEEIGKSVRPFFDQWVFKPGHPVLDLNWSYDPAAKAAVAHVRQLQDTAQGTPVYATDLTLGLVYARAKSPIELRRVRLDRADQEFRLPTDVRPDAVLLDPDHDLLKEIKDDHWSDAELRVIARYAPNVVDRRAAVKRLVKQGEKPDAATINLLAEIARREPGERLGVELLDILREQKDESLRALFREQARSRQDARRVAALRALAGLPRLPEDTALFRAAALDNSALYSVVQAGMEALAGQYVSANLDVFRRLAHSKSSRDRLARKAIELLADAKHEAAAPLILETTGATYPVAVRVEATRALAGLDRANASVHSTLVSLLKEESQPDIQRAAIKTIKERKDREALPLLQDLASKAQNSKVKDDAREAADAIVR